MKVYKRICLRDWHVKAANGDRQDCTRGKTYTTSRQHDDGTVTVMSSFWVRAPVDIFEPLEGRVEEIHDASACRREPSNKGTTEMSKTCNWVEDDDGVWDTECGNRFELIDDAPHENDMYWCPYCGLSLQEVRKDAGAKPRNIQHVPFTAAGWSDK